MKKLKNKKAQKNTKFIPSEDQLSFLRVFISSNKRFITELAKEAGVPRRTIYNWRENPAYVEWFNQEITKAMKAELPDVYRTLKVRTAKSDTATKLFLERFDEDYSEKKKVNWEGNLNAQNEIKITVIKTEDKEENENE